MANGLPRDEDLVLPPNQEILPTEQELTTAPLGSIIDTSITGQFNRGVSQAEIDLINRQVDPLAGETPAIIDATNELFVPSLNQPILRGTSSSQTLGSQPIFVAGGGNIPFAAFERQKQARQAQALKQAEDANKFKLRKAPLTKDPRLNKNLNETFNEFTDIFIKRAEEQFGDRVKGIAALTNPATKIGREFIQQMDNLDILASQADQIIDEVAKIDAAIESGDQFVPKESEELSNRIKQNLSSGDIFAVTSLRGDIDKLQTSQTLDQFFKDNKTLSNIEGEITKRTGISDFGDFKLLSDRERKEYEDGAREQARAIKENIAFRNRDLSEDDIFNRIIALKGRTDKVTKRLKTKPKIKGGKLDKEKEDIVVNQQGKVVNSRGVNKLLKNTIAVGERKNPVKMTGLSIIDPNTGLTTILEGSQDVRIIEVGTTDYELDGVPYQRRTVAVETAPELDDEGDVIKAASTEFIDYDNNKAQFKSLFPNIANEFEKNTNDIAVERRLNVTRENIKESIETFKVLIEDHGATSIPSALAKARALGLEVSIGNEVSEEINQLFKQK